METCTSGSEGGPEKPTSRKAHRALRSDPLHRTREVKVYCAVVLDVFSRRVVGWSIDGSPTSSLVTSALGMALANRKPNGTVIHFDREHPVHLMGVHSPGPPVRLVPSMGSIGDCFDNAIAKSFWARMQVEPLNRQRWRTRIELANAIFEYLEVFHNRQRRHSGLGMRTRSNTRESTTTTHPQHSRVRQADSGEPWEHQRLRAARKGSLQYIESPVTHRSIESRSSRRVSWWLMRVVVTGCAGFIGSTLVKALLARGDEVVGIDAFIPDLYPADVKRSNIEEMMDASRFRLVEGDLRTMDLERLLFGADAVVNEAAIPGLTMSWEKLDLYMSCNVTAVGRLLQAVHNTSIERFLHISTSSVYGASAVGDESLPTRPMSPYGVSKLASEHLVGAYAHRFGIPAMILRYFSVYGPRQRPDMGYHLFAEALIDGNEIVVFGDGTQSRSVTFIDDCVRGTLAALDHFQPGGTYNIAGGEEIAVLDTIRILADEIGKQPNLRFADPRPGDQRITAGVWAAAQRDLGFEPSTDPETGLRIQARWHSARRMLSRRPG